MLQLIRCLLSLFALVLILGACQSSNSVVSNRWISKRKYTKGFHVRKGGKNKGQKDQASKVPSYTRENFEFKPLEVLPADVPIQNVTKEISSREVEIVPDVEHSDEGHEIVVVNNPIQTIDRIDHQIVAKEQSEANMMSARSEQKRPSDAAIILLIVLLFLIIFVVPPVAVALLDGVELNFWIDLALFVLGYGLGIWLLGAWGLLLGIPSIVYAIIIFMG